MMFDDPWVGALPNGASSLGCIRDSKIGMKSSWELRLAMVSRARSVSAFLHPAVRETHAIKMI